MLVSAVQQNGSVIYIHMCYVCSVASVVSTLCHPMDCSLPVSSVHGIFHGKNTGVGCHALLQGILRTQESNWGLLLCRQILYQLSHHGIPYIYIMLYVNYISVKLEGKKVFLSLFKKKTVMMIA